VNSGIKCRVRVVRLYLDVTRGNSEENRTVTVFDDLTGATRRFMDRVKRAGFLIYNVLKWGNIMKLDFTL
jgi:hypothetical protein